MRALLAVALRGDRCRIVRQRSDRYVQAQLADVIRKFEALRAPSTQG